MQETMERKKSKWNNRVTSVSVNERIVQLERQVSDLTRNVNELQAKVWEHNEFAALQLRARSSEMEQKCAELEERYMWLLNMVGRVSMANETEVRG